MPLGLAPAKAQTEYRQHCSFQIPQPRENPDRVPSAHRRDTLVVPFGVFAVDVQRKQDRGALSNDASTVLLFFSSTRSGPSRRMESLLAHIARKERHRLRVVQVDVD